METLNCSVLSTWEVKGGRKTAQRRGADVNGRSVGTLLFQGVAVEMEVSSTACPKHDIKQLTPLFNRKYFLAKNIIAETLQ